MRYVVLLLIILPLYGTGFSQQGKIYKNKIFKEEIKTVILYREGWEFTYPVFELDSDKKLILKFDDTAEDITDYYYTIVHCSSDWEPSDLNTLEYIDGFEEDQISDYESSFNTLVSYTHYTLMFPNDNMKPTISGNYILLVYEDYDKENLVLSRRFFVVDKKVEIDAHAERSSIVSSIDDSQEVSFEITDKQNLVYNPIDNLKVNVLQNNDPNFAMNNIKLDFIKGNIFEYKNPGKLLFKGGNEFRYVNLKNYRYVNERINSIHLSKPYYIFELLKETSEAHLTYSYVQDLNGGMLVVADNVNNRDLESEYVYVDFTYVSNLVNNNGGYYVYGSLSDRDISDNNKMVYDYGTNEYKLRMLLKQGFYNYEYVFVDDGSEKLDLNLTEGNHYETENFYVIYVYHKPQGSQYDQLIGYKIINTFRGL